MAVTRKKATEIAEDDQEYYTIKINTMSISQTLLDEIIEKMPIVKQRKEFLLFILVLARTRKRCKKTGGIKFSRNVLAAMLGKHPNKVRLLAFLEECKATCLPELTWTKYEYMKGLCTVITDTGIQDLLDRLSCDIADHRVFLNIMKAVTEKSKQQAAKQLKDVLLRKKWLYEEQDMTASYLNSLPYNLFVCENKHFHAAYSIASDLDEEIERRNKKSPQKNHHKTMLLAVRDMWKPFYYPIQKYGSKTPRIFGTEPTFLKSTIIEALYPDWITFDLKNCHLAIVAYLFDTPQTRKFLETGKSIWDELMEYMGVAQERQKQAKAYLKIALYSMIFGMAKADAQENLYNELACRGIWWNNDFKEHPLIQEIARVLKEAKKKIITDSGMDSAYGWMPLTEDDDENSVLSCAIQTYELASIGGIYKLAVQEARNCNSTFDITLHQHDGINVILKKGASIDAVETKIQKAVTKAAEQYGIEMKVERKVKE